MEDIHDIKGLIEILPFWREHIVLILILTALLCLGIILFLYFKFKKIKHIRTKPNLPQLTPYEQAIKDLVDAREFMKPGFDKLLSTKSSDIIRQYLEKAFQLQASEKTTEEFLHDVQTNQVFNGKALDTLVGFLEMCDLAKFAKIEFTNNEQQILFEKANLFLELAHKEEITILEKSKKEEGIHAT